MRSIWSIWWKFTKSPSSAKCLFFSCWFICWTFRSYAVTKEVLKAFLFPEAYVYKYSLICRVCKSYMEILLFAYYTSFWPWNSFFHHIAFRNNVPASSTSHGSTIPGMYGSYCPSFKHSFANQRWKYDPQHKFRW